MDKDYAAAAVERVAHMKGDDEAAHSAEDTLYHEFVEFVATQDGPYADIAKEILKTQAIQFQRWCA